MSPSLCLFTSRTGEPKIRPCCMLDLASDADTTVSISCLSHFPCPCSDFSPSPEFAVLVLLKYEMVVLVLLFIGHNSGGRCFEYSVSRGRIELVFKVETKSGFETGCSFGWEWENSDCGCDWLTNEENEEDTEEETGFG